MKVFRYVCPECEFESAFLTEKDKYLCADCGIVVVVKQPPVIDGEVTVRNKTEVETAAMRTRNFDWLDTRTNTPMYGIEIYIPGTGWRVCGNNHTGKPLLYDTEEKRDRKRSELRKAKP